MTTTINRLWLSVLFLVSGITTIVAYWLGLNSPFLLDDIPNMEAIGRYAHLGGWRDFALYLLQGDSGANGRPLSLATFYINDQTWHGMDARDFKYTNLMLHLLNGVLVFGLTHRLLPYLPLKTPWKLGLPLLVSSIWLLHPMHTNTVLYAVQRMTELSAFFSLVALLCYLHGREQINTGKTTGWIWLVLGFGFATLLATLSKENGALTVMYLLVIEYTLLRPLGHLTTSRLTQLLRIGAWLALGSLSFMLFKWGWIDRSGRAFTTTERLMTEMRIIWDYLSHILIPRYHGNSLLHDDIIVSKSLIHPMTTLFALLGLLAIAVGAWFGRQRYPVVVFGIAWFFAGHLLESTTIALELYFEHRNYLPMLGLVFVIAYYALYALQTLPKLRRVIPSALAIYTVLLALSTYHIGTLWSEPEKLMMTWLAKHPNSQRTWEGLDAAIGEHISSSARQALLDELERVAKQNDGASYLVFRDLKMACTNNTITGAHLNQAITELSDETFLPSLPNAFADFIQQALATECGSLGTHELSTFIEQLRTMPNLTQGEMPHTLHYWQAEVHAKAGNLGEAMTHFDAAYAQKPDLDLLLLQSYYLSSAGLYEEATSKLDRAEQDFCQHWRSCLTLKMRQPDLDRMRDAITHNQQQQVSQHDQTLDYPAR